MYTKHGHERASQRGYTADLIGLIREFGEYDGDRLVLTRKELLACLGTIDRLKAKLLKLCDKGGGTAVFRPEDDGLITVYRPDSFRQPKQSGRGRRNQNCWA